ncbi:uncharacterized protein LOC110832901 isoform X2 [Zootermopsis nevadensis]|nr:uncharacterized protein LOC110832901 isoform X2 [Zootermopsis nevadensis]
MLAEVASQTLHSDPSVKISSIKRTAKKTADISCHFSKKKKQRATCNSRSREGNTMDLEYLRSLKANHLLKLFSEFDGDEIRRIFTFTCFMEPDQCHQQFSSFGSEGKARQQMKTHLLEHVHQLELKAECGFQFSVESVKVRQHRLAEKCSGSNRRHKLNSKIKVESIPKSEPSDENDSSLPNKEKNNCSVSENSVVVKPNLKPEKFLSHEATESFNENNNKNGVEVESILDINESRYNDVIEKVCDTEEKCVNNENCYGIYEEHNYVILDSENNNTDVSAENHRKCTWPEMKINQNDYKLHGQEKQGRIKEDSVLCDKAPAADLGKFMIAETLRDMVMVCVMEEDQVQLKQLPCVGQEVDVDTHQSFSYKMIRSDDLPVVQDNRRAEPQDYSDEVMREMNCEKRIERDEYIQKKKPKGKAKFIGQSKAEKEMAIHLIEMMKRKGNSESLECYICNPPRSFTAPTTLISHYRSHAGIKPYECRICHSVFTRQHSLNYHMLIHSNQTRFTCADCGRKFRHPSHFKEHRRRHTGESPYECSDCMLRFKTRNTYKRHLKTRHGKVLTTSGGLIILSEEEFRRVRTLPRSPHSTAAVHVKQELHNGKKRSRKGKGRFKVGGKRKQLEPCDVMNEEDEEEEIGFNFNREISHQSKACVTTPTNKDDDEEKEDASCVGNVESEVTLPMTESEPPQKSFQDIVEEAMRQSNISFTDDLENDKANLVMLDVPITNTENVYGPKDKAFETHEVNKQGLGFPIKSSWNTDNVNLKSPNEGKMYTARNKSGRELVNRSAKKNVAHLQAKTKKSLILPNNVGFNPLMIKTGIHQAQNLPTILSSSVQTSPFSSSTSSSSASFLSPQCEVDKKSPVSTQSDAKVLNVVGSDRVSIISANSQQATIMLIADECNSFTAVSNQNYILKGLRINSDKKTL